MTGHMSLALSHMTWPCFPMVLGIGMKTLIVEQGP